jgi:NADH dehydrogenase
VAAAVRGADAVVNLVGVLYESGRYSFSNLHQRGAASIAKAAKAAGVMKLVHVSALGASSKSSSNYAQTKAAGENAVKKAFPKAVIMRPSVLFGPEDGFFNLFAGMSRFSIVLPVFGCPMMPKFKSNDDGLTLDFYGEGGTKFQPVYVNDVAAAVVAGLNLTQAEGRTYELAGPTIYSFKQLMEMLLKYTNRKRLLVPVPFFAAEILAMILQTLPKPLLTRDQVKLLKTNNVMRRRAKGLKDLGIKPTTVETIIPIYLSRFRLKGRNNKVSA